MDARGRRHHVHRGDSDAGEGADHPDRAAGRCDEGVRPGGVEPAAGARRVARDSAGRVHADRRAPAPAGRGGAEGRSVGRDRDRDGAGVAPVPPSGAPRCGDDGRAHAARAHPPDRRAQGEADGGGARRRQDGAGAGPQPERRCRRPRRGETAARDQAGGDDRRGARARAARAAPVAARGRAGSDIGTDGGAAVSDFATLEEAFQRIGRQDDRYHERGYLFVLAALEYAQGKLPARRHLSGGALAWACRGFAREQFGLLAPTVLGHWGIATTEDLGRIVLTLIDVGLLDSQPTDKLADFERFYDFEVVLLTGYS